jgi:hypothetical protein
MPSDVRVRLVLAAGLAVLLAACSGQLLIANGEDAGLHDGGDADAGPTPCSRPSDCPLNTGASCAATCSDGSNPCINACVDKLCELRGCPVAYSQLPACTNNWDCSPTDHCSLTCAGSPCQSVCINGTCSFAGCNPFSAAACFPNGEACGRSGDCCSDNCILGRGPLGYCCEPGGCP